MNTIDETRQTIMRYGMQRGIRLVLSGVYDLFPERPRKAVVAPDACWPEPWPQGRRHGISLFFSDASEGAGLLYVGKASKQSSCIRVRLNGYVDMEKCRASGRCVLREEWNGYRRPWGTQPRYVVTVALETDDASGECPEAERLEAYLIQALRPDENIVNPRGGRCDDEDATPL
jgi:hypothetical protein